MKKSKRRVRDIGNQLAHGFRQVPDLIRGFLGLEKLIQGVALIAIGLLVVFAGAFTQTVVGVLIMVSGGYLLVGGRLWR